MFSSYIAKTDNQIEQLKKCAIAKNSQNEKMLTACLRCDRPGYASYSVQKLPGGTHGLILSYDHINELAGSPAGGRRHRKCQVGPVLGEGDLSEGIKDLVHTVQEYSSLQK